MTCVALFMAFLIKFQHANCCWDMGKFGWFFEDKPNAWFTFDKHVKDFPSDSREYFKGDTVFFDVDTKRRRFSENQDVEIIERGKCKLDNKKYFYIQWIDRSSGQ